MARKGTKRTYYSRRRLSERMRKMWKGFSPEERAFRVSRIAEARRNRGTGKRTATVATKVAGIEKVTTNGKPVLVINIYSSN